MTGRLVITGTGRCGTKYTSNLLNAAGMPTGHETVFTFRTVLKGCAPEWRGLQADVSWLVAPHLPDLDVRSLLLVRHPLDVVHFMLALNWFIEGKRPLVSQAINRHRPEVHAETTRADKALAMWSHWNLSALPYVSGVIRMEDMIADPAALLAPAGVTDRPAQAVLDEIRADPERVSTKADKKVSVDRPDWGDFRTNLAFTVRQVADIFGYEV